MWSVAARVAIHAALRRGADVRRGGPAGHGSAKARGTRADGLAERPPSRGRAGCAGRRGAGEPRRPGQRAGFGRRRRRPHRGAARIPRRRVGDRAVAAAGLDAGRLSLRALHLRPAHRGGSERTGAGFRVLLSAFVRGRVHLHFDTTSEAEEAVREAGFASAVLRRGAAIAPAVRGPGSGMVHILEASSR